jgi:hypothetical protein
MRNYKSIFLAFGLGALVACPAFAEGKPDLDSALKNQAGKILEYARSHNAKNIGVLKFLVRTGDGPWSDNAGPLNLGLARRLTVALILAAPNDEIGIIGNANEALTHSHANHLTEDGRMDCFRGRDFILSWGDPEIHVRPDLFITGTATLSKDLKQTTIHLQAFGKDGQMDDSLGEFTVNTTARTLIDTGHSYLLTPKTYPKLFDGARGLDDAETNQPAVDASQKYLTHQTNEPLPSIEQDSPIRVLVYYGDEAIPIKDGAVREPKTTDKVWFKLDNVTDDTYGVVLKVNGVNTIFKETFGDRDCHKWIIKPHESITVRGFQIKLDQREDFKVLPPEESRANEVRYGEFAGLFQFSVFRAKNAKSPEPTHALPPPPGPEAKEEQQVVGAISRGVLRGVNDIQPSTLQILQSQLRKYEQNADAGRGMIDSDSNNPKAHEVKKEDFTSDPGIPVMSYQIRYYQPGK